MERRAYVFTNTFLQHQLIWWPQQIWRSFSARSLLTFYNVLVFTVIYIRYTIRRGIYPPYIEKCVCVCICIKIHHWFCIFLLCDDENARKKYRYRRGNVLRGEESIYIHLYRKFDCNENNKIIVGYRVTRAVNKWIHQIRDCVQIVTASGLSAYRCGLFCYGAAKYISRVPIYMSYWFLFFSPLGFQLRIIQFNFIQLSAGIN